MNTTDKLVYFGDFEFDDLTCKIQGDEFKNPAEDTSESAQA